MKITGSWPASSQLASEGARGEPGLCDGKGNVKLTSRRSGDSSTVAAPAVYEAQVDSVGQPRHELAQHGRREVEPRLRVPLQRGVVTHLQRHSFMTIVRVS